MPKIERHAGTIVHMGSIPFAVGSGYRGATEELDAVVARAAEMMAQTFGRDVEIRFNSDRRSGSAWIKDSLPGLGASCQVGLGAGLCKARPEGLTDEEWWSMPRGEYGRLPDELYIDTKVDAHCLRDPALAREGRIIDSPYSSEGHASLEDGLAFLVANVNRDAIKG